MRKHIDWDIEIVKHLYWDEDKSLREIADIYQVTTTSVKRKLNKAGIPCRSNSAGKLLRYKKQRQEKFNRDELERLYWKEGKAVNEIARIFGVCRAQIYHVMEWLGIPRRSNSQAKKLWASKHTMPWAVTWDKDKLVNLYWNEEKSTHEIGSILGCSGHAVGEGMKKLGIPFRSINERAQLHIKKVPPKRGSESQGWKGGRINHDGYVHIYMPEHPYAIRRRYVPEHRLVMERKLGRYLLPSEKVHHLNSIKNDNRLENLQLMSQSDHRLKEMFCQNCTLRKEIRLLRWEMKQLREQLQYKLREE